MPPNLPRDNEQDDRDGVHRPAQQRLVRVHHMDVLHAKQRPRRKHHNPDRSSKIAPIDGHHGLNTNQRYGADVKQAIEER